MRLKMRGSYIWWLPQKMPCTVRFLTSAMLAAICSAHAMLQDECIWWRSQRLRVEGFPHATRFVTSKC